MTLTIRTGLTGLNTLFDELEDAAFAAVRPAAQAAAQVLYDDVRRNVAAIGTVSGNLAKAIYQVFSVDNSGDGRATYHVSWNHRRAPHGQLIEFGHIQRYAQYRGKDGNWYTAVRPEMRGKPRPSRRASQGVKDAYYVKLAVPKQVAAKPFLRPAVAKLPQALAAAETELLRRIA